MPDHAWRRITISWMLSQWRIRMVNHELMAAGRIDHGHSPNGRPGDRAGMPGSLVICFDLFHGPLRPSRSLCLLFVDRTIIGWLVASTPVKKLVNQLSKIFGKLCFKPPSSHCCAVSCIPDLISWGLVKPIVWGIDLHPLLIADSLGSTNTYGLMIGNHQK